ncbi:unnamed protein product [Urochloa decumbens]|uniref:DUF3475 domain-containing protein n=1 Tax=Urochloa decumbens TaxID=240449 RepID=A0ABC9H7X1_9POAL
MSSGGAAPAAGRTSKSSRSVGILAFEVGSVMSKLLQLWRAVGDAAVARLRHETIHLDGVRKVVSEDEELLLGLARAELLDALRAAAESVAALAGRCADPALRDFRDAFLSDTGRDRHRFSSGVPPAQPDHALFLVGGPPLRRCAAHHVLLADPSSWTWDAGRRRPCAPWRAALAGILEWLAPMAHATMRWQAERSFEYCHHHKADLDSEVPVLLLQTLHMAERHKVDAAVVELLVGLNYVWRFHITCRARAAPAAAMSSSP